MKYKNKPKFIVHTMKQGTPEWDEIRKAKITASVASKMITPTGKPSVQADGYIGTLLAEAAGLQDPEPIPQTYWVERGSDLEKEARKWLQVRLNAPVHECGFIESPDGLSGFSPDGYVVEDGYLIPVELKVPKPSTHINWFIGGSLPNDHKGQVHFAIERTGAPYSYFMSYNPMLTPLLVKVPRDDYTESVGLALAAFTAKMNDARIALFGNETEEAA